MDAASIPLTLAFAAGVVSFLSPCVLPLVPAYLSLITGLSLDELAAGGSATARRRAAVHAALFALGFGAVFVTLGAAATGFGHALGRALPWVARIGGAVIVLLGLHLLGVLRASPLDRERRLKLGSRRAGGLGSLVAGVAFGAGWTPCMGPILASILLYSTLQHTVGRGMLLLAVYALGLALPFFAAAAGFNWFLGGVKRLRRWALPLERAAGALLVLVGLLMAAGRAPVGATLVDRWRGSAAGEGAERAAAQGAELRQQRSQAVGRAGDEARAEPGGARPGGPGSVAGGDPATSETVAVAPASGRDRSGPIARAQGRDPDAPAGGAQAGGRTGAGAGTPAAEQQGSEERRAGAGDPGRPVGQRAAPRRPDEFWGLRAAGVDVRGIGYNMGAPDAPVSVVEFSDFGCPYCRQFALESYPALYDEFVRAGKVRWKYVPFVLGIFPNGEEAARAAECAGEQDRFGPMHDMLYQRQAEWKKAGDPQALFRSYAGELELSVLQFSTCYRDGRRDGRTLAGNAAARKLAIRGTPTFFVEGFPVQGAIPLQLFRDFLGALVAEKTGGP